MQNSLCFTYFSFWNFKLCTTWGTFCLKFHKWSVSSAVADIRAPSLTRNWRWRTAAEPGGPSMSCLTCTSTPGWPSLSMLSRNLPRIDLVLTRKIGILTHLLCYTSNCLYRYDIRLKKFHRSWKDKKSLMRCYNSKKEIESRLNRKSCAFHPFFILDNKNKLQNVRHFL